MNLRILEYVIAVAEHGALAGAVLAELAPPLSFPLWLLHRKTQLTPAAEAFRKLT